MRHLLKLIDLSQDEIYEILDLGIELKNKRTKGIPFAPLKGKTLAMIFQKSSTRTRVSFEVGMYQLGGEALFLSSSDIQMGRGESIEDTARVLSRYVDGIMIRTFAQQDVEDLAKFGTVPVINGLTDFAHPCQVLADLMTVREYKGGLNGLKLAYIGDGNNMANSLIVGCLKTGMKISVAVPDGYRPDKSVVAWANAMPGFELVHDPLTASEDADVVVTDVWASMGMEKEAEERKRVFAEYTVNAAVMDAAKSDAIVLHCLPAHKGEEIQPDIFDAHAAEIFDEAENRLHVQKAVMTLTMGSGNE